MLSVMLTTLVIGDMNSGGYLFANPLESDVKFNTSFDSRDGVEYFEVHAGPITTRYGETFWRGLPAVPLPADVVERFAGKTMAVVGYEQDQVIKSEDGKTPDQSVPIYWAYNHHYVAWLKGAHATLVDVDQTNPMWEKVNGHPMKKAAIAINDPNPDSVIPTSQFFSEGNGGESRKSYHGYPPKRAQLIDSPTDFQITPMQIDTWNRNTSYGEPFKAGPESPQSTAPAGATYSGHLECPCTDRITKTIIHTFKTVPTGACPTDVQEATVCFEAAAELGYQTPFKNVTVNSSAYPVGCSYSSTSKDNITAIFNAYAGSAATVCGGKGAAAGRKLTGAATSYVTMELDIDASADTVTISLTGPSTVWYGVGLGAQLMKDAPNAIIVQGNGSVFEQKLADQSPGSLLPTSVTVVSNSVSGNRRTVVLTRALKGKTAAHYTFDVNSATIPFINAVGKTPNFSYHQSRAAAMLNLVVVGEPTCVCDTGKQAYISSDMNPARAAFRKNCKDEPHGDLIKLNNPTCTIEQYQGGLSCCTSGNILLSKDQNPWPENKLTYYMKWRFYFEDYTPAPDPKNKPEEATHQDLVRFFKCTEADAGEYDVVAAPPGTAPEDQIYQITAHFQVQEGIAKCNPRTSPHCAGEDFSGINLVYASHHCHAPSCIKSELWNADTGELICRQEGHYGVSAVATKENPYDEIGYVAIPPCLFGSASDGLQPEPYLKYDTNLTSIKWNNNSVTHYGEMAM